MNRLKMLEHSGQSLCLEYIRHDLLVGDDFKSLIEELSIDCSMPCGSKSKISANA